MSSVDLEDLKGHAEDLIDRVKDAGESIEIVDGGRVVAILIPSAPRVPAEDEQDAWQAETEAVIASMDRLAARIATVWPDGVSALDAIDDVRRDL